MISRTIRAAVIALVAFAVPTMLVAQDPAVPAEAQQQEVQTWLAELQQIQARLGEIQTEALEDAELRAQQEELGTELQAAIEEENPELAADAERIEALEQEAVQAQQSGDQEQLQQLAAEAQQIQTRFAMAQAQVLERPEVASKVEAFEADLEAKMVEIDPEADALIERYEELGEKVQEVMGTPTPQTPR